MRLLAQTAAAVLFSLLAGCGWASMESLKADATTAFQSGDFQSALEAADKGLEMAKEAGADKVALWNLEDIRLKAVAGLGDAEEALYSLERLATDYPNQIDGDRYIAVAHGIKGAEDWNGAIDVAERAKELFADRADDLDQMMKELAQSAAANASPEVIERLKSLGYL